jgi:hypothetical protein
MFQFCQHLFSENSIKLDENIKRSIYEHLNYLRLTFDDYFPTICNTFISNNWIRNPFQGNVSSKTSLNILKKENLILNWLLAEYTKRISCSVKKKAIKVLLPFCTTYQCEKGFSACTYLKYKYRNRLNAETDLRLKLCDIEPNLELLCSIK